MFLKKKTGIFCSSHNWIGGVGGGHLILSGKRSCCALGSGSREIRFVAVPVAFRKLLSLNDSRAIKVMHLYLDVGRRRKISNFKINELEYLIESLQNEDKQISQKEFDLWWQENLELF